MKQAMRLNPRYPPIYLFNLGWTYRLTERHTEAVTTLKEAISRNPNLLYAHLLLAISYTLQWMYQQSSDVQTLEEALKAAQRGMVLNGDLPFAHTVLGHVYLCQKQYEQAVTEMKRAIALDPDSVDGYAVLAEGLSRVGKLEEALYMVEQALRHKPSGVDTYSLANIGGVYYRAGRYEEAIATLKQHLAHYPNHLGAHLVLARVYSELGREAEAGRRRPKCCGSIPVLVGDSPAENADQRSGGVGAAYCRVAQGGAEVSPQSDSRPVCQSRVRRSL